MIFLIFSYVFFLGLSLISRDRKMDLAIDQSQLDEQLKLQVQLLVSEYTEKQSTSSNHTASVLESKPYDKFIENLFDLLASTVYKGLNHCLTSRLN